MMRTDSGRAVSSAIAVVVLAVVAIAVATPAVRASAAGQGDIGISLAVESPDGAISAFEPLVIIVTYKNLTDKPVSVGLSGALSSQVQVLDSRGKVLAQTVRPSFPYDLISYGFDLKPGETKSKLLVISSLYSFEKPGVYAVKFHHLALTPEVKALAEASLAVRVLPFNAKRLDARCDELRRTYRNGNTFALYSVRNDVALPYLDYMARDYENRESIEAINRIGSKRSKCLLKRYAAAPGKLGEVTRKVMSGPPEKHDVWWMMGGY